MWRNAAKKFVRPNTSRDCRGRTVFPPIICILTPASSLGSFGKNSGVVCGGEEGSRIRGCPPPRHSQPSWIRPCAFSSGRGMRHVRHANGDGDARRDAGHRKAVANRGKGGVERGWKGMAAGRRVKWRGKKFEMRRRAVVPSFPAAYGSGCHEYCIFNSGRPPPVPFFFLLHSAEHVYLLHGVRALPSLLYTPNFYPAPGVRVSTLRGRREGHSLIIRTTFPRKINFPRLRSYPEYENSSLWEKYILSCNIIVKPIHDTEFSGITNSNGLQRAHRGRSLAIW